MKLVMWSTLRMGCSVRGFRVILFRRTKRELLMLLYRVRIRISWCLLVGAYCTRLRIQRRKETQA